MFPIILGILCGFCAVAIVVVVYILQNFLFTDSGNSKVLVVGDYVNLTYSEQFEAELEKLGYSVTVEWVASSEHLANTVISQKPEKNARRTLHAGSPTCPLTLVVSSGENLITLPDYTGMEYRAAILDLKKNKINYVVEKIYNNAVEDGLVISTYPNAGTVMGSDTQIKLYVSKGGNVQYVTVPDLTGLTAAQLDAKLKSLNLRLGKVSYTYSDTVMQGLVISQSLVSGVTVQAGITSIDIVVSLGSKIEIPSATDTPNQSTALPSETVQPQASDPVADLPEGTVQPSEPDVSLPNTDLPAQE